MMGSSAPLQPQCASTANISENDYKDCYCTDFLESIKKLFISRYDCYAVQSTNNPLLFPTIYESLTDAIILDSLEGLGTIGIHQIGLDNKVKWLCWDIDRKHTAAPKLLAETLIKYLKDWYGLSSYLEKSGSPDSYHVWLFIEPVAFETAYAFNKIFLDRLKALVNTKAIEKGISKGVKGLGCMIKLPLNINRKNGIRSEFLGDLAKIVPETLPALNTKPLQHNPPPTESSQVCVGVVLKCNTSADIETCKKIIAKNPAVLRRIRGFKGDRSGMDFLITKCLTECGIPQSTIYSFLKTVPHSKIHERGYPYFKLTYDNVLKTLSHDAYFLKNKGR